MHTQSFNRLSSPTLRGKDPDTDKLPDPDARGRGGRNQAPTAEREERPGRRQQRPRTIKKSLGKQKTTSEDPTNTTNNQP